MKKSACGRGFLDLLIQRMTYKVQNNQYFPALSLEQAFRTVG